MVVIELSGEKIGPGEAIIFRSMVTVVLMGRNGVAAKTIVLRDISRQAVVMAEENCLAIPGFHQLGRNGAVECPNGVRTLGWKARMKFQR